MITNKGFYLKGVVKTPTDSSWQHYSVFCPNVFVQPIPIFPRQAEYFLSGSPDSVDVEL